MRVLEKRMWPVNPAFQEKLISTIRGKVVFDAPLGPLTWFRVGGNAQVFVRPKDVEDLSTLIQLANAFEQPVTVLGVGSNVIIRDGGIPGVVIRLGGSAFTSIDVLGEQITAGAGALDRTVAETCREHSLGGLEFLVSIPGTMGGAVRMNAGAYGREMKDLVTYVEAVDEHGHPVKVEGAACGFVYRASGFPASWIVTRVHMQGVAAEEMAITQAMQGFLAMREQTQPVRARTGGSTFKNPESLKAWQLIDAAGCRGLERGGAQVSPLHCNFLINTGQATAQDIEDLGEDVRARVLKHSGVTLEWEIKRLGLSHKEAI